MTDVVVAVPTFRRPRSLARLLAALSALETSASVRVLVADNDAKDHEGFDLCSLLAPSYRWPLHVMLVPERGIAQARNALVKRALADPTIEFIAMLDDDEWPTPDWLEMLTRTQAQTGAQAIQGSVMFELKNVSRAWVDGFDGLSDIRHPTGPVDQLRGTGNLMIARAVLENMSPPYFDLAFGLTGGEDRDFFARLKAAGCKFAWADEAIAHSIVPTTRQNLKWALERAYSIGNSDMRVFLKYGPTLVGYVTELAKTFGALFVSLPLLGFHAFNRRGRRIALRMMFRAAGKTTALFGLRYNVYSTVESE